MPNDYTKKNAVYCDSNNPTATIAFATRSGQATVPITTSQQFFRLIYR
jgi:L-cystine uptake protein TcyP (sodium:dicarboxylate symporter family)